MAVKHDEHGADPGSKASDAEAGAAADSWRGFLRAFISMLLGAAAVAYGTILALDPYGLRARPGRAPSPIMDLNQRFIYPQIVRGGGFDGAVFGTSTIRLLDPRRLGGLFGARIANLGLNAGTPWEQTELASLFLRHVASPKLLIFGLDRNWCEADADAPGKRLTGRAFPPWLYDEDPWNDYAELFSLRGLEVALRVGLHHLGLRRERIRGDGYEVFVPPEERYDLARARQHIWHGRPRTIDPITPPVSVTAAERAAMRFPALAWLEELLDRVPPATPLVLAAMPIHVAAQPRPGSLDAARDAECKARVARIGQRHGATVVDFRLPSPVTTEDANYWDPLHYRLGIADRITAALARASKDGRDDPEGFYRVLGAPAVH